MLTGAQQMAAHAVETTEHEISLEKGVNSTGAYFPEQGNVLALGVQVLVAQGLQLDELLGAAEAGAWGTALEGEDAVDFALQGWGQLGVSGGASGHGQTVLLDAEELGQMHEPAVLGLLLLNLQHEQRAEDGEMAVPEGAAHAR